jgi:hypothetical protein
MICSDARVEHMGSAMTNAPDQVRMEFAYDGGGLAKGGDGTNRLQRAGHYSGCAAGRAAWRWPSSGCR